MHALIKHEKKKKETKWEHFEVKWWETWKKHVALSTDTLHQMAVFSVKQKDFNFMSSFCTGVMERDHF
jgi:hypothetical protein